MQNLKPFNYNKSFFFYLVNEAIKINCILRILGTINKKISFPNNKLSWLVLID